MGMSIGGGGDDEPMMDINMTPLIDVMLVLLIMFIITIPVMTHAVKAISGGRRPTSRSPNCTSGRASAPSTTWWPGFSPPRNAMACARSGSWATSSSCDGQAAPAGAVPAVTQYQAAGVQCPGGFFYVERERGARPRNEAG